MHASEAPSSKEQRRLDEEMRGVFWKRWGPYLSERSWGTVREDYSPDGNAWDYLPHDLARSKAYRWGEDGIAGISDRYQLLCLGLAFWNERDPILKERMFGLVPKEGNHGEDVKEYYYYLDSTPTHSYLKYLYKYPQKEFPYRWLIEENQRRGGKGLEFELLDTGIFDDGRYFDIVVEYAKDGPDDVYLKIEAFNRGPDAAPLHIIPQLWFRNTWAWTNPAEKEPLITLARSPLGGASQEVLTLCADDTGTQLLKNLPVEYELGKFYLYAENTHLAKPLFTFNETNMPRVYGSGENRRPYVKDAFHRSIVQGEQATNPVAQGTKAAIHYRCNVPAHGSVSFRLRLSDREEAKPLSRAEEVVSERRKEADEFFNSLHPEKATADQKLIQRQALSGMLWGKQIYLFDVDRWLKGDNPALPPPASREHVRNKHWKHLNSMRVLSMPDKWEYPWFAAWDSAFHAVALSLVDIEFAKEQLWLFLFEQFLHPSGQIPAYEYEFSDLNPPVHAWAVWRVYNTEKIKKGKADRAFLEKCFHKLLLNFTWWINKVDSQGNNIFEGGFLGLDNITVLDRSEKLPEGMVLEQSDATGWMGFFALTMMRMALELARENPVYEGLATKFFQHYVYVGAAMKHRGGRDYSLWDNDDGFFYDVLRHPDGHFDKFRVRSLVGLIPLFAVERLEARWLEPFPDFRKRLGWFLKNRQDLVQRCCWEQERDGEIVHVLTILDEQQLTRVLQVVFDEEEFLSPYGLRSLSKFHEQHPFRFGNGEVKYEPAESDCKLKGGNSNWRGPLWFPTTFLLIESLRQLSKAYGPKYRIKLRSGKSMTFGGMARELATRMVRIFERGPDGKRPVFGGTQMMQVNPYWKDNLLFYEYFHGDNGAGLGASHQTGWSGLVAALVDEWAGSDE